MTRDNPISRRTALKLTGAAAGTALVAGCGGDDNGNGNGDENGDEGVEIDPGTEILFTGEVNGWVGNAPSEIEGETNPTLILQDGETYQIGWEEGDGSAHNLEIWDDSDEVVGDYETDEVEEPDDDQILEIEVSDDMAYYVCDPHDGSMRGEIQVE